MTAGRHRGSSWLNPTTKVLTTTGPIVAVVLMALLTAINFLGIKRLAAANSAATWWKVAIPLLTILVSSTAIYYWAMAVSLSSEEIEEMVSEVVPPEEQGLEV